MCCHPWPSENALETLFKVIHPKLYKKDALTSFELRPKYIKKCQYNSLHKKDKNTLQHLKLEKLKFGIHKIGCSMS